MRCEDCGRAIRNAEMWQLAGGRDVPSSRSMRTLCRQCREAATTATKATTAHYVQRQAEEIVRRYQQG
jgi:hypothetical protein